MRDLFNIFSKDIKDEDFTLRECVIYGIVAPMILIILAILSSLLQ